jgi:hypothetical protein
MNLLMLAPLFDSRGKLRYYIGAQVDVSGLVKDCTNLEGMQKLVAKQAMQARAEAGEEEEPERKDEFQELSEMFNMVELGTVKRSGGKMHYPQVDDDASTIGGHGQRPRLMIQDPTDNDDMSKEIVTAAKLNGKLEGIYKNVSHVLNISSS